MAQIVQYNIGFSVPSANGQSIIYVCKDDSLGLFAAERRHTDSVATNLGVWCYVSADYIRANKSNTSGGVSAEINPDVLLNTAAPAFTTAGALGPTFSPTNDSALPRIYQGQAFFTLKGNAVADYIPKQGAYGVSASAKTGVPDPATGLPATGITAIITPFVTLFDSLLSNPLMLALIGAGIWYFFFKKKKGKKR